MKLISVLNCLDDDQPCRITDYNAPINECLQRSTAREAKENGLIRNGVVVAMVACNDTLHICVDIEYQKKRRMQS